MQIMILTFCVVMMPISLNCMLPIFLRSTVMEVRVSSADCTPHLVASDLTI